MRRLWACCIAFLLLLAAVRSFSKLGETDAPVAEQLKSYIQSHHMTPEDYVVSKFQDHDIVFLGEYHRIKHDPELVQALIPRLYKAGVFNLGLEFGASTDQAEVDRMLNGAVYDEGVARKSLFHMLPMWGYKEYEDIYRAAWQLNHSLPAAAPRFRIVNLNTNFPEQKKVDDDAYMAKIILDEFVSRKQKALVYCGMHHAFTRYHQPKYDFEKGKLLGLNEQRTGNLVYKVIGNRAMTISLHFPWISSKGWDAPAVRPVNGVIDEIMSQSNDTRVGFDVVGTPFESLPATDTYYALGYPNFKLADFTDGYIYQTPFREYQGVTVDPQFITRDNFKEALTFFADPEIEKKLTSPEVFLKAIRDDADIQERVKHLH